MAYDPLAVANYFLELGSTDGVPIDHLKLQKLLYYAHGWYLAVVGKPLLDEPVQAWKYGPVVPSVYQEFKRFGNDVITVRAERYDWPEDGDFQAVEVEMPDDEDSEMARAVVQRVWSGYKRFSGLELSTMSHEAGSPWALTWDACGGGRSSAVIPDDLIREHFVASAKRS